MNATLDHAVPDFTLAASDGQTFSLSAQHGQHVILYFYPKDNTPGCTNESCDFNALLADFSQANCRVYGISRDSIKKHVNFSNKLGLPSSTLKN